MSFVQCSAVRAVCTSESQVEGMKGKGVRFCLHVVHKS